MNILKPEFLTEELLNRYRDRKVKLGGLIKNEYAKYEDDGKTLIEKIYIPVSKEVLGDIKNNLGLDYVITSYIQQLNDGYTFNPFIETLTNADEVGIDVIANYRVFAKDDNYYLPENIDDDRLNQATQHISFKGIFHDEPTDEDKNFEEICAFYEMYSNKNIKMDLNLFPNAKSLFDETNKDWDKNKWNTGRTYQEYVERYLSYSDTLGADYYPIYYYSGDNKHYYPTPNTWNIFLKTYLDLHHKYPEKDYKLFIQTSKYGHGNNSEYYYNTITTESLSIQTYAALLAGANDIRYFCLSDDSKRNFIDSPLQSNSKEFAHGETYDIIKNFNTNSKFKYIKDFIASKYISDINLYTPKNLNNDFVSNISKDALISTGYDDEGGYCFILNLDLESDNIITLTDSTYLLNWDDDGILKDKIIEGNVVLPAGEIIILKNNYITPPIVHPEAPRPSQPDSQGNLHVIVGEDDNNEPQLKQINQIFAIKDGLIKTINNIYVITATGIKQVWSVIKDILSAFGLGYWFNDSGWDNDSGWKN